MKNKIMIWIYSIKTKREREISNILRDSVIRVLQEKEKEFDYLLKILLTFN